MAKPNLNAKAREVMDSWIVTATRKTTGRDIAIQLLAEVESGMPVIGSNQQLIGVVTEFDILRAMQDGKELDRIKTEEIMSAPPISVEEETSINEVLTLMRKYRILSVLVVQEGKLVGMIFRRTLLKHLVNA